MLHRYCSQFLAYCELADFSARSIQTLSIRLNELAIFLKIQRIRSVKKVRYRHLIDFTADYSLSDNVFGFLVWNYFNFRRFFNQQSQIDNHKSYTMPPQFMSQNPGSGP
jgi:hypothetical protein